jgi:hypothetical protein
MKKFKQILRLGIVMLLLFSCEDPDTVVTNYVHPDGSVTRKVVMKRTSEINVPWHHQVPVDSSWNITKTLIPGETDTTWVVTAEKFFASADEINEAYRADSGSNRMLVRSASFKRSFRWFYTFYRYSEKVERILFAEVKAEQFFTQEDISYFYMPAAMRDSLRQGADSLMYIEKWALMDTLETQYLNRGMVEAWCAVYLEANPEDSAFIHSRKELLTELMLPEELSDDSIFSKAFGQDYTERKKEYLEQSVAEFDTLFEKAMNAKFYTCETIMPGKLIATNGFPDHSFKVSWPVDAKYFLSQDYEMWAESKTFNIWAWMVSGGFVLFVLLGLVWRWLKEKV